MSRRSRIRSSVESVRRMRHLAPGVMGLCLVMAFASVSSAILVHVATGGNQRTAISGSGLSAATGSPSGPLKIPWVATTSAPTTNCFGGANPCTGTSTSTTAGEGTTCVISSFWETAGDFMYVAVNYLAGTNLITSVSDGGTDAFTYIAGEFATGQSVALYDVGSVHGGTVTITVTLSTAEFGTCRVGQLSAGTTVGVVGAGGTANSDTDTSLEVTNTAAHEPSLLLALFGSTRPSGPWEPPSPSSAWIMGGFLETGYNPGTNSELIGYNDTTSGTVTFTQTLENSGYDIYLSGIVVEFYLVIPSGWPGYAGNAVYPTYDTNTTYLPAEQATAADSELWPNLAVNNSLVLSLSNTTPSGQNYGLYYFWNSTAKAFDVSIPFVAVGGSNFTDWPLDGLAAGPVYEIGAMHGVLALTGLGDPSEILSVSNGNYLGLNTTVGNYTENFPGGDDWWLGAAIFAGITTAEIFFPEVTAIEVAAYADDASLPLDFLGAYEWNSQTINETTNTESTGVSPQISVWAATSGGSFNTNKCKIDGGTGTYTCGQNVFSEAFGAQVVSPNAPVDATPGWLQAAANNQIWVGVPSRESPSVTAGAAAGLSYPVEPGVGIGGEVTIFPHGPVAPGAQITLQQDCANAYSDFIETSSSTGYWHFFGNPGCIYSYWVNWDGYWYDYSASLSSSGTISPSVTADPGQDDESVNIDLGGNVINFVESGLPANAWWSVTCNGEAEKQSSSTNSFVEANGSYTFSVGAQTGYAITPSSGSVTVPPSSGYTVTVNINFLTSYSVIFSESGLPSGTTWSVTLGGVEQTSSTSTITFSEPNGTYSYTIGAVPGYAATPLKGSVKVAGAAPSPISIAFSVRTYTVTFQESGLPSGTSWSVTLGGTQKTSTTSTITFTEPNATYDFTMGSVAGYAASPASGYVTVSGSNVTEAISFSVNTGSYTVTFTESGLPSGDSWDVIFNGVEHTSTSTTITFTGVLAGTYSWSAGTSASAPSGFHWSATPSSGSMTVSGGESQGITFLEVRNP